MDAPANMKFCEMCNKHIHKSSFAKHLKSKLHLQNIGAVIPQEAGPVRQQQPRARSAPTLKQLARAKVNVSNRELEKEIVKK